MANHVGSVGATRKVSANWSQETMTCHSSHCFSIVWGQGNAPLVTSLPSSCYMTNHVGAQSPPPPISSAVYLEARTKGVAGMDGGRGIGCLWPNSGNSDCYKTNQQQCSHVSWKKLMKLYKTCGNFNEASTEESWTLCFQIYKSWGFQGYM